MPSGGLPQAGSPRPRVPGSSHQPCCHLPAASSTAHRAGQPGLRGEHKTRGSVTPTRAARDRVPGPVEEPLCVLEQPGYRPTSAITTDWWLRTQARCGQGRLLPEASGRSFLHLPAPGDCSRCCTGGRSTPTSPLPSHDCFLCPHCACLPPLLVKTQPWDLGPAPNNPGSSAHLKILS